MNIKYTNNSNSTIINKAGEVIYITLKKFNQPGIKYGFSTRIGGVSKGYFSSLNFKFDENDSDENVRENYIRFANAVGVDYNRLVFTRQTHTTNIKHVDERDVGKGLAIPRDYNNIDGLVTNKPNIPLVVFFADCVPILFFDNRKKVIGVAHSGWRGTVNKISSNMIKIMCTDYGCNIEDISVAIGPSICKDCYEVSEDVAKCFKEAFSERDVESFLRDDHNGKFHLDLWKANECILINEGILSENINITDMCTCCNKDFLFSHRATNGKRGVLGAVIMLEEGCNEEEARTHN